VVLVEPVPSEETKAVQEIAIGDLLQFEAE